MSDTRNHTCTVSRSILLVEDDRSALELLASMLVMKYPDVSVHTAGNGKAGLDIFTTYEPDIVITDINMPEMCGEVMSEKIRSIRPCTKIIVLTGRSANTGLLHEDNLGVKFDHLLIKPVNFFELFTLIEKCFAEIIQRNQTPD